MLCNPLMRVYWCKWEVYNKLIIIKTSGFNRIRRIGEIETIQGLLRVTYLYGYNIYICKYINYFHYCIIEQVFLAGMKHYRCLIGYTDTNNKLCIKCTLYYTLDTSQVHENRTHCNTSSIVVFVICAYIKYIY